MKVNYNHKCIKRIVYIFPSWIEELESMLDRIACPEAGVLAQMYLNMCACAGVEAAAYTALHTVYMLQSYCIYTLF